MSETPERRWDRQTVCIAAFAACASLLSFLIYFRRGEILLFGDAVAHINIARRVFDSRTPGPLQLGTVWLPLPHLLLMPLIVSKWAWRTGVGGSIPSMVAHVFGVLGIYRLTRGVTAPLLPGFRQPWPTCLAAAIYGLNPNLLYLQATAMTEPLYLAFFVWAVVHCRDFLTNETGQRSSLWKCGLCLAGAALTRYDGWFVVATIAGVVIVSAWRDPSRVERQPVLKFVLLAAAVPLLWFAYNGIIYRNALEFANGPYSARAIEKKTAVPGFPPHPGTNDLPVAAAYFLKAGMSTVVEGSWQAAWLLLAFAGTLIAILGRRWPALLLWSPLPFYMLSVAYGGVPIFAPDWWPHSFYNIRYGVQLLPVVAVFSPVAASYLASRIPADVAKRVVAFLAIGFVVLSYASIWRATPVAFREAWVNSRTRLQLESQLANRLQHLPPDSTFLMYLGDHVGALQEAGIPLRRSINEGNHRVWKQPSDPEGLWERSLADPSQNADFVVATEGDTVWQAVHAKMYPIVAKIEVPGQRPVTIYRAR